MYQIDRSIHEGCAHARGENSSSRSPTSSAAAIDREREREREGGVIDELTGGAMTDSGALVCSRFLDRLAEMVPAKYFVDSGKVSPLPSLGNLLDCPAVCSDKTRVLTDTSAAQVQDTGSQFWHSKSVKAQKKQEVSEFPRGRRTRATDLEAACEAGYRF